MSEFLTQARLLKARAEADPKELVNVRTLVDTLTCMFPPTHPVGNRDFLEALEGLMVLLLLDDDSEGAPHGP